MQNNIICGTKKISWVKWLEKQCGLGEIARKKYISREWHKRVDNYFPPEVSYANFYIKLLYKQGK